jgi:hypothetical protein
MTCSPVIAASMVGEPCTAARCSKRALAEGGEAANLPSSAELIDLMRG